MAHFSTLKAALGRPKPHFNRLFSTTMAAAGVNKKAHPFERAALDGLLIKRFFYCPAFEIYGGELEGREGAERELMRSS